MLQKMKIRVRDDDVLGPEGDPPTQKQALGRFKQIHSWIQMSDDFVHVPAIVVQDLAHFPTAIEYMIPEIEKGKMIPEVHGYTHIDYGVLSKGEVKDDLEMCQEWIYDTFNYEPKIWYTPWGASQPHLWEAAKEQGLQLVDCNNINKLEGEFGMCRRLMDGEDISFLDGIEIFMHWWTGGSRLKRVIESVVHGSWEAASKIDREHRRLFNG